MKLLELFCGTKSIAKAFEDKGHETLTIDIDRNMLADVCTDLMRYDLDKLPDKFKNPEVIWASPPCQAFSVATISRNWNKDYTPKTDKARLGIELVKKTIEIIEKLKPRYFFIENPRCMLRKMKLLDNFTRHTVTYCQYGDKRMKPTDIWTNCDAWTPRPPCKQGAPCHERAPRGCKTGMQGMKNAKERGRIPRALCIEIAEAVERAEESRLWGYIPMKRGIGIR